MKFVFLIALALNLNAINIEDANSTCPITLTNALDSPKLLSVIENENGEILLFSSPKAMFDYTYKPENSEAPYKELYVTNYANGELIRAKDAVYLFGSRFLSVSGDDLIAFDSNQTAAKFMDELKGKTLLDFNRINSKLVEFLNER